MAAVVGVLAAGRGILNQVEQRLVNLPISAPNNPNIVVQPGQQVAGVGGIIEGVVQGVADRVVEHTPVRAAKRVYQSYTITKRPRPVRRRTIAYLRRDWRWRSKRLLVA